MNVNITDPASTDPKAVTVEDEDDHDYEAEARSDGWAPESEWQGAPPKHGFQSAKEFVKRGREVLPIVKAKNRRMEGEIAALKSQLTEVQGGVAKFNQFAQAAVERERREKQLAIEQLENRRAEAISSGDGHAAVNAERQISQIKSAPDANYTTQQTQPPQYTEEQLKPVKDFIAANPWYTNDPDMRDWADARSVRLKSEGHPQGEPMLRRVAEEARKVWAHKLQPSGSFSSGVESSGHRQPEQFGKKTFDDLPPEAKRAYDEFKRTNQGLTKTQYLNLYEWD